MGLGADLNFDPECIWAWISQYPDGTVGLVGGYVEGVGHLPLIGRSEKVMRSFQPLAKIHAERTGQRVWLRRYVRAEDHGEA